MEWVFVRPMVSILPNVHTFQKKSSSNSNGSRPGVHHQTQRVVNPIQTKAQKLKDTRDYSFLLSDDAKLPRPSKLPPPNARPVKSSLQRNQVSGSCIRQPVGNGDRRPDPSNGHLPSRSGANKLPTTTKPSTSSLASKRQLGGYNGIGTGRPGLPKGSQLKTSSGLQSRTSNGLQSRMSDGIQSRTSNGMLAKKSSNSLQSKASNGLQSNTPAGVPSKMPNNSSHVRVTKSSLSSAPRATSAKVPSSVTKHQLDPRREVRDSSRNTVPPKWPIALTKPQISRPKNQVSSHMSSQDQKIKKRPVRQFSYDDDDGERAISMIRKMFGYNPQRYAGREEDDSDMEANFDEIVKEEKRSARIVRKEDDEQLRLIEEEERQEHMRKMAKKRKMSR